MKNVSREEAHELAKTGVPSYACPSLNSGCIGTVVDKAYELPGGLILEFVCRHGWLYDYLVWTPEELKILRSHCPWNVKNEIGIGR